MSLERTLRRTIDRAACRLGVVARMERRMARGLTVLMYHRVLPEQRVRDYPFPSLAIPERAFGDEMKSLARRFRVLPLGPALEALAKDEHDDRPLVSVTFDDGYADNHALAAPLLEAAGVRATFFVTSGFVADRELLWFDRAALALRRAMSERRTECARTASSELALANVPAADADDSAWIEFLKRVPRDARMRLIDILANSEQLDSAREFAPMTSADVADLARRGHEIGSHTVRHELLPELDAATLADELARSKAELERWTSTEVRGFCYPNGDHDERSARAVRAAGYTFACTTGPGLNTRAGDVLRVGRTDVTPVRVCSASFAHDDAAFRAEVCGLHEAMR